MKEIKFKRDDKIKVIAEVASYIDSLENDKQYSLTIKEHKKKRSLDANAYTWVLLDRLAAVMHESKEQLYKSYIKDIGGNSEIVCIKTEAAESLQEGWSRNGLGWQSETMPSKLPGCTNVILYYGSSTYDVEQMSRLIDMIIQDCKIFGIETKSTEELEKLCTEWGFIYESKAENEQ